MSARKYVNLLVFIHLSLIRVRSDDGDDDSNDKGMDLTPASISRRRRRVIESDDEEQEQNVAPISRKRQRVIIDPEDDDLDKAAGRQQAPEGAITRLEGQVSEEGPVQPTLPPTSTSAPPMSAKGKGRAVEVEEDEFDVLDIELDEEVDYRDEFVAELDDEVVCGEDEFVPGHDENDEDLFETPIKAKIDINGVTFTSKTNANLRWLVKQF